MDILFLITGFICACITPFLHYEILGFKGIVYFLILIAFSFFVLAYAILSIYKFKIAKIDYLNSKKIISWNIEQNQMKNSRLPYVFSLMFGVALGVFLAIKQVPFSSNLLLSLALAFSCLGWWLMGIKRLKNKEKETDNFLLSHVGLIYDNKVSVFNGYSKGITNVNCDNNNLNIELLNGKKQQIITVEIPKDKQAEVYAFLVDLKEYFSQDANEE